MALERYYHVELAITLSDTVHSTTGYPAIYSTAGCYTSDFTFAGSKVINPRRACAAGVTVVFLCVCLFVCLSVCDYSRTTGYEVAYER